MPVRLMNPVDDASSQGAPQGKAARRVASKNRLAQGDEKTLCQPDPPAKFGGRRLHALEPSVQCLRTEVEDNVEILGGEVCMKELGARPPRFLSPHRRMTE